MKKLYLFVVGLILFSLASTAQSSDFIPGGNTIFEDNFSIDPVGDLPAKWSTSGSGQVVELDGFPGKWLKIISGIAFSPELTKKLPEDCTIEFDLIIKNQSCPVIFGLTPLSDVSAGNVNDKKIFVTLQRLTGYPGIIYGKDAQDLGNNNTIKIDGYINRVLHVAIAANKTRFRVYLDENKAVDMPKLLSPEYRNNFFISGGEVIPAPEDGIYISNIRLAAGEADARRLLVKQLLEQGSVVTNQINFNTQTNQPLPESLPMLDTLGKAMINDPNLNIQVNGLVQSPSNEQMNNGNASIPASNTDQGIVKMKVDNIKNYLISKFNIGVDRIVTGVSNKAKGNINALKTSSTGTKLNSFITEILKL